MNLPSETVVTLAYSIGDHVWPEKATGAGVVETIQLDRKGIWFGVMFPKSARPCYYRAMSLKPYRDQPAWERGLERCRKGEERWREKRR